MSNKHFVDKLNRLISLDQEAMQKLFDYRVSCNEAMDNEVVTSIENTVSLLGLINTGEDDRLIAHYGGDNDDKLLYFTFEEKYASKRGIR